MIIEYGNSVYNINKINRVTITEKHKVEVDYDDSEITFHSENKADARPIFDFWADKMREIEKLH